jgi:hypothetical protein
VRLGKLTDDEKVQKLTSVWIAVVRERGYEPTTGWICRIGRAIRTYMDLGKTNRELLDTVRAHAEEQDDRVQDDWAIPA